MASSRGRLPLTPRLPAPWLRRSRLNDRVSRLTGGQVALVAAPAGSGKTSLLADWFTHDRTARGAWLTLDARDNEPGRLGPLVSRALARDRRDRHGEHDTVAIDRAFEAVARSSEPAVLVLDAGHGLTANHALATELADATSGSDDAALRLEDLERRGLFVTALDGDPPVYRFHSLFGALLRARLSHDDSQRAEILLRRAATWFADHDMPAEAEA